MRYYYEEAAKMFEKAMETMYVRELVHVITRNAVIHQTLTSELSGFESDDDDPRSIVGRVHTAADVVEAATRELESRSLSPFGHV